jgi:hypothetical protein
MTGIETTDNGRTNTRSGTTTATTRTTQLDDREASAYRNWQQERNENREFSKLNRKEQSEYWRWRHEHPDNDRDRH